MSDKNGLRIKLRHIKNTVECGIHSGIPDCCIKYYVTKWMWLSDEARRKRIKRIVGVGYVPCPQCLKKKKFVTTLKKCNCWHRAEQADQPDYFD